MILTPGDILVIGVMIGLLPGVLIGRAGVHLSQAAARLPRLVARAWRYLAPWELPGDIRWLLATWHRYLTGRSWPA